MPDPINAGVDFASRLASNVYGLHKQDQDRDRLEADAERNRTLDALMAMANSGDVHPDDKAKLWGQMFTLNGAKSKDVSAIVSHLQGMLNQPDTTRTATFNHQSEVPGQTVGSGDFQTEIPAFALPAVPTTETMNTPAIRLMSPEEKANRAAQAQVSAMQTTYPQRKKELDEAHQRKLELQGAALDAKDQARINAITTKGGIDAAKKFNERVNMFMYQAGGDPEVAKGLASKSMIADEDAALAAKKQQAATGAARAKYIGGMLDIHKKNAETLSRRVDLYAKSLEETARSHKANESRLGGGGQAVKRNLAVLMANTKELYTALTPLNNAIVKLQTDPLNRESDGTLMADVKTQVDDLITQRDAIKTKLDAARQKWLPSMPEPIDGGVIPPVPQQGAGVGGGQSKGMIRRGNLGAVRTQNPSLAGLDDNALVQYLQAHGYTVK